MKMFGKLLKYETKAMSRVMLPFYGALLAGAALLSIFLRVSSNFDGSFQKTLGVLLLVAVIGIFVAGNVVCLVLIIQRFYRNLLGDEGYLMFSLPATTGQHIACKTVSAAIWSTAGLLVGVLAGFIVLLSQCDAWADIWYGIDMVIQRIGGGNLALFLLEGLVLVLVGFSDFALRIYASISLGHLWSEHRVLGAILAYIGLGAVLSAITTPLSIALADSGLGEWIESLFVTFSGVHIFLWILVAVDLLGVVLWSLVSRLILTRHLNLQ